MNEDDTIRQAGEDILDTLGAPSGQYIPVIGNPVNPCRLHIERDSELEGGFDFQIRNKSIEAMGLLHELSKTPQRGDRFIVDGITYVSDSEGESDGYYVTARVKEITDDGI